MSARSPWTLRSEHTAPGTDLVVARYSHPLLPDQWCVGTYATSEAPTFLASRSAAFALVRELATRTPR